MSKTITTKVIIFFLIIPQCFLYSQSHQTNKMPKEQEEYSDEPSGVMVDSEIEDSMSETKTYSKKTTNTNQSEYNSAENELEYNFKEYEFKNFKIKIPDICKVKMNANKTSAVIGSENSQCFFTGKILQLKQKKMPYLINMYKNRCKIKKSQLIMKKWIKNNLGEGYLSICADEKADMMVELNSNKKKITYQISGNAYSIFTPAERQAFMYMIRSIQEK